MGKPLSWVFSAISAKRETSQVRILRNRLAVTTILAVTPFLGYGRQAYAACVPSPSPTFICSGTSAGEGIFANNADVSTLASPAFVVTSDGVFVSGLGNQRFIDNNASTSITNNRYYGRGLSVISTGDDGLTPGAVTIFTDGTISGTAHGIYAYNDGSGDITITANGTVTGVDVNEPYNDNYIANDGIYAENHGNNLTVTTGVGSTVTGEHNGIDTRNYGSGDLTITANGDVTGNEFDAIYARNFGENLNVTVGAQATVDGAGNGVQALNYGSEDLEIIVDGSVTGQGYDGIHAVNSEDGNNLIITTGAGSLVKGNAPPPEGEGPYDSNGIDARNYGEGYLKITADGEVFGNLNDAIYAKNYGTDLTITTGAGSLVRGGGNGIGAYNYGSGDLKITALGQVGGYSYAGDGIKAYNSNNGGYLSIVTGTKAVKGGDDGIQAENLGHGNLTITTNGTVTGENGNGITAINRYGFFYNPDIEDFDFAYGVDLTITANQAVTGDGTGIFANNQGTGNLTITANGNVTGETEDGIYALDGSEGGDLTIITGSQTIVSGNADGIEAKNFGEGELKITVNGDVTGATEDGIYAKNGTDQEAEFQYFGTNLTVETNVATNISGASDGIDATNNGTGNLTITALGTVTGEDGNGIEADNSSRGVNLSITTGAASIITGGEYGIEADNDGEGDLTINAYGQVTGESEDGIFANNDDGANNLTILTGAQSVVSGFKNGINATNEGFGDLTITAYGTVTGLESDNGDGIEASNSEDSNDLTILTGASSIVTGGDDGIDAGNDGDGHLKITANGTVTGTRSSGIEASNSDDGTYMAIITGAGSVVTGIGDDGIKADHEGEGNLEITANGQVTGRGEDSDDGSGIEATNDGDDENETIIKVGGAGLVQGNYAGMDIESGDSQAITITNDGLVRNLSAESDALAIKTEGGATHIVNNSNLLGFVTLDTDDFYDDVLDNHGFWNSSNGTSDFGEGLDEVNNTGTLLAADDPTFLERTELIQLEAFNNDGGLISLVDGQEGDTLRLERLSGSTEYTGTDGRLAVDTVLGLPVGADRLSDELIIAGNTNGTTLVQVNVVDANGANLDGIPVVVIEGGTTAEEDFDLDGPVNGGFFTWDLRYDAGNNWHELFTTGVGVGASEFAAGLTGMQDIFHQTLGTLLQRQADLRALLGGTQVTPVADFAEEVAPTPVANITPGFWLRGVGAYLERDDEEDGFILDRKQTIWGGMAGFDFGTESAGDAWLFGLFGGYLTSELKFDETNSEWTYEGPSVGVYATYMDQALYASALVKADFLDIEIDPDDLGAGSDGDTDAVNIGGLIDAGYKFGHEVFIEPQAALAVVHTEIDDVDIFGGTVEFDDETSIRGRLGLRLGVDHTGSDATVYSTDVTASVWEEFAGNNDVSITDPVFGTFGASDDKGSTYGDVSLGFSMAAPEGWSSFIRGNYLFGEDFEAISGNAGVRYAF